LAEGGQVDKQNKFLSQSFEWFDETGHRVTYQVKDFVETTNKLQYRYDKLINTDGQIVKKTDKIPNPTEILREDSSDKLIVRNDHRSIIVPLNNDAKNLFNQLSQDSKNENKMKFSIQLDVNHIMRGIVFDMYLDLPGESQPHGIPPYFIRPIIVLHPDCNRVSHKEENLHITNCFDVTSNLKNILKLQANYHGAISDFVNLTFVPKTCGNIIKSTEDWIKFNRIQLVQYLPQNEPSSSNSLWLFNHFYWSFTIFTGLLFSAFKKI